MSAKPLSPAGIYRLVSNDDVKKWEYVRREEPIRTRLFLVGRKPEGRGAKGR